MTKGQTALTTPRITASVPAFSPGAGRYFDNHINVGPDEGSEGEWAESPYVRYSEDHERQILLPEVISDSQTCLASADDHGSELLTAQGRQLSSR